MNWNSMDDAPRDGTKIIALCEHVNAQFSEKPIAEGWIAPVIARWIDHNGGGWTWYGLCGRFTGWRALENQEVDQCRL